MMRQEANNTVLRKFRVLSSAVKSFNASIDDPMTLLLFHRSVNRMWGLSCRSPRYSGQQDDQTRQMQPDIVPQDLLFFIPVTTAVIEKIITIHFQAPRARAMFSQKAINGIQPRLRQGADVQLAGDLWHRILDNVVLIYRRRYRCCRSDRPFSRTTCSCRRGLCRITAPVFHKIRSLCITIMIQRRTFEDAQMSEFIRENSTHIPTYFVVCRPVSSLYSHQPMDALSASEWFLCPDSSSELINMLPRFLKFRPHFVNPCQSFVLAPRLGRSEMSK